MIKILSFARAFVNNAISLDQLAEAMRLGELGKQIVLASPQAFAALRFQGCEIARASTYHVLRNERDRTAREAYRRKSVEADRPPISTACSCATLSARK